MTEDNKIILQLENEIFTLLGTLKTHLCYSKVINKQSLVRQTKQGKIGCITGMLTYGTYVQAIGKESELGRIENVYTRIHKEIDARRLDRIIDDYLKKGYTS